MSVDVVCAGMPFLDITFLGLPSMPSPGRELLADRLEITPGGLANVALGLTRLGLEAAICSPVGGDVAGRMLAELLREEGIAWEGPPSAETAVSAVLTLDGDRAFATFDPRAAIDADAVAAMRPRAVVIDLPVVDRAPAGAAAYAVVGDVDARALAALPPALAGARALLVNAPEAALLAGIDDVEAAALALGERCPTVVVTLGAAGSLAVAGGRVERAGAPDVPAVDTNGAGDLFTAAYVWADLCGHPLPERLRLATAYASLSVRVPTTRSGALPLDEFLRLAGPTRENGVSP